MPDKSTKKDSTASESAAKDVPEVEEWERPDFIYGGPFIQVPKEEPFMDTAQPMNYTLTGTFKKSFAYYSLKERMPVILTKIIDYCSRDAAKIKGSCGASDADLTSFIQHITLLKQELITNKTYRPLEVATPEAKKWNDYIASAENPYYFNNTWLFTECYVYRRLWEGCELIKGLSNFDYFDAQKEESFQSNVETMCMAADTVSTMLTVSEKDKRKADFIMMLKLSLWSNKCDLSLSAGANVALDAGEAADRPPLDPFQMILDQKLSLWSNKCDLSLSAGANVALDAGEAADRPPLDPFQMILDQKDKLLNDDTNKITDQVQAKAEKIRTNIANAVPPDEPSPPEPAPAETPDGEPAPEPEKIPCPAKMTVPQCTFIDIVCDNSGYELFADLCLAHFLIAQEIVQKIRFHVKRIPWFVSDVTPRDFTYVIEQCASATHSRTYTPATKPGEEAAESKTLTAANLNALGEAWKAFVSDGTFVLQCDDFWTSPHPYKDMKKYDYNLYRKLQYAVAVVFKGDLNYRKLLGERRWPPYTGFEPCLQGFIPAPIIAIRVVKSELICAMPKGSNEKVRNIDPDWMKKGIYGQIQYCAKAEALKVSDRPCLDYGKDCYGVICPTHTDL